MELSFKDDEESLNFVIDELIRMKVKLNNWERNFISNIRLRLDERENFQLTKKQLKTISDMWEKY